MRKALPPLLRQAAETLALTAVLFLILVTFVVQGYKVYGNCMEPNLSTGERLLGNKFIYRFDRPCRGDVIVFRYPKDPAKVFVKRVIACPGETVEIRDGKVYVNDSPLQESDYVRKTPHGDYAKSFVPNDCVFVLGDNRDDSNDSRSWGLLPVENIQAKAWLRYYPLSRMAVFRSP